MGELEDLEARVESLELNLTEWQKMTRDHEERFDTLQTPLWKRLWFRVDGWPGQRDLNASGRSWRPWRR